MTDAPRSSRSPRVPSRLPRYVFLTLSAVIFGGVVALSRAVMLPFVLALVIAYVLTPLVAWVEAKRAPRPLAIIVVYVVVLGSLYTFVRATAPRIGQELVGLRNEIPVLVSHAQEKWVPVIESKLRAVGAVPRAPAVVETPAPPPAIVARPQPDGTIAIEVSGGFAVTPSRGGYVVEPIKGPQASRFDLNAAVADAVGKSLAYIRQNALELARIGRDIVLGVSRAIFIFGITLMLAAYLMMTREKVIGFWRSLVRPDKQGDFTALLERVDRGLAGVVRGQLVICLINGALSAIGFAFIGLKYWPVLAIVATVFSLVPIFGSIASAVPAVALGLTQSFGTALFVLLWIVGIHQLEANFLNPKILGDAAKIHPVLVILSLLIGEHFFGVMGALLAVPTMSIAQSLFLHFREVVQRDDPDFAVSEAGEADG
jgi:predicted PurR-regulated permease PerM